MRRTGVGIGLFFVVAGVLFLLDAIDVLRIRASFLWPLLLIGFGIALIAGGRERRPAPHTHRPREERPEPEHREEQPPEDRAAAPPPPPPPTPPPGETEERPGNEER